MCIHYHWYVYHSLLLKYLTNSNAAASKQPWRCVAGWCCLKYSHMSLYVSTVLLICLLFIVVQILGKQHCCSKWTALKLCCRLMSKISIHGIICVYSIVDMSIIHYCWNIWKTALLQQSEQPLSYVAGWCLKYIIHVLICAYSIVDMSIIHYYWDIRQTVLLQHVNSLEVMLLCDV